MAVVLFDTEARVRLFPFTYTKAVADLRFGIFSIKERWQRLLNDTVYVHTAAYLQALYPVIPTGIHTWINAAVLPSDNIIDQIKNMRQGEVLEDENEVIACKGLGISINDLMDNAAMDFKVVNEVQWLLYPFEILSLNKSFIALDFALQTTGRTSLPLSTTNQCLQKENVFIEEGASVEFSIINASEGPVYIGSNATVMEGSLLKGPLVIGDNAVVKMGTKMYGATTLGPNCTAGGEIKNVVMQANSNKAHDGYLGDSIIGDWCNLGAGVSNSNVKNTAGDIKLWSGYDGSFISAGNKCGVMMGDYTRVAINSSINTGSVYGVSCNVFGDGLLPRQLRNFSWGAYGVGYAIDKAVKHIGQWKNFKNQSLSAEEESVLTYIFDNFINQ